jgi:hypothetical protein
MDVWPWSRIEAVAVISGRDPRDKQLSIDGMNGNAAMRRAGKVHPPLACRGYANVAVECVQDTLLPRHTVQRQAECRSWRCLASGRDVRSELKFSAAPEMEELKPEEK